MKKYFVVMLMGLLFNACSPAYVTVRPTHLNIERPMRPSANHVWVDGNWIYSRQTRTYSKNSGYWVQPNRGKKYTQGQWKSNRKGSRWVQGRWK